jgi:hypothetical protein
MSGKMVYLVLTSKKSSRRPLSREQLELVAKEIGKYMDDGDKSDIPRGSAIFLHPPKY